MAPPPPPISLLLPLLLLLLLLTSSSVAATVKAPIAAAPTTAPSPTSTPSTPKTPTPALRTPISTAPLDPNQVRALQSLDIPASRDPCSPLRNSTAICDNSTPYRHLVSLTLANCSDDVALSTTALKALNTLSSFHFVDCPIDPIRFPSELVKNLRNFTCISSLKRLNGVWLSRLVNVTDLTVSRVTVNASGPAIILESLKRLKSVTITQANLTGVLPKHWHPNLTYVDLSGNQLKGRIPPSLSSMEGLWALNLSHNSLDGTMPATIGDLTSLQNLSLSSNSLSGPIPDSIAAMPDLVHLDLGSNQLNGTVPKFIGDMKKLKYLNLEKNNFHGVLPFNASFFNRIEVLKVGGNDNLCYNHSTVSRTLKLGISPCDRHGLPMSPPPSRDSSANSSSDDDDDNADDSDDRRREHHHGPSKVVLVVAIGLSSIVFLIIFLVLLSKCCK